jgi:hypothetical protein
LSNARAWWPTLLHPQDLRALHPRSGPRVRLGSLSFDGMEYAHGDEVRDDGGEGGSDRKEEPAISLPEFAEAGGLSEYIRDVGCAVGDVGHDRQEKKAQSGIE